MSKLSSVLKYDLKRYLRFIGMAYLWMIGIVVVLPTIVQIISNGTNNLGGFIQNLFSSTLVSAIFVNFVLLFCLGSLTYERFEFFIQNGISRRTAWASKWIGLTIMALVANIYNQVFSMVTIWGTTKFDDSVPYLETYGKFFGERWMDLTMMFVFTMIFTMCVFVMGMFLGSIFALLARSTRRIVYVAIPLIGVIVITILGKLISSHVISTEGIDGFLRWCVGYNSSMGYFNPLPPLGIMLAWIIIGSLISRYLNLKLKIKRGE
ncbi:ABC transporter permease [Pediococcus argentinicus]|uniref:ABC transporter permease n=1 Tax=Pediococcus argentinicus TaxID=480391 RepID=UPI00338DB934